MKEDLECFVCVQRRFEALAARRLAAIDRRHQSDPPQYEDRLQFWLQEKFNLSQNAASGQIRTARQFGAAAAHGHARFTTWSAGPTAGRTS